MRPPRPVVIRDVDGGDVKLRRESAGGAVAVGGGREEEAESGAPFLERGRLEVIDKRQNQVGLCSRLDVQSRPSLQMTR